MTSRTPHDQQRRPLCPYCGTASVKEIYPEDDARHRHVCMNKDCDKISSNRMRQRAGLPVLYPDVKVPE